MWDRRAQHTATLLTDGRVLVVGGNDSGDPIARAELYEPVTGDLTDLLNYAHLWPRGSITFKGAHQWRYPVVDTPFTKHSVERNAQVIWRLQREGSLDLSQLVTHVIRPEDAILSKCRFSNGNTYCGAISPSPRWNTMLFAVEPSNSYSPRFGFVQ